MTTPDSVHLQQGLEDRSAWRTDQCPVGRSLGVVGTRSALLIMREALYGTTRFDDFAARVAITEAVAAARLRELTAAGLLRREPYQLPGQRTRHEYRLTDMGRDLAPVVLGLLEWGAKYLFEDGQAPVRVSHDGCGADVSVTVTCDAGHPVPLGAVAVAPSSRSRTGSRPPDAAAPRPQRVEVRAAKRGADAGR